MQQGSITQTLIETLRNYDDLQIMSNIASMNQGLITIYFPDLKTQTGFTIRPLPIIQNIQDISEMEANEEQAKQAEIAQKQAEKDAEARLAQEQNDRQRARFKQKMQIITNRNQNQNQPLRASQDPRIQNAMEDAARKFFTQKGPKSFASVMTLELIKNFRDLVPIKELNDITYFRKHILENNEDLSIVAGSKKYLTRINDFKKVGADEIRDYILPRTAKQPGYVYQWAKSSIEKIAKDHEAECDPKVLDFYEELLDIRNRKVQEIKEQEQRLHNATQPKKTNKKKKSSQKKTTQKKKAKKSSQHHSQKK